jgi:DNA-binding protein H-NS
MAKKAKRRGRPPGAKSPDKMDIGQLRQYIEKLQSVLGRKVSEQRAYFEEKLSELTGLVAPKKRGRPAGGGATAAAAPRKGTRRKATPKYRSRKDPKVMWSGRGVTPVWMREEMKGSKLKKEDFLIKA